MSENLEGNPGTVAMDAPPFAAEVFPGDAAEGAATLGASAPVRADAARQGWRVVQAVGACAGVVLARAMVRTSMPANALRR
jgi:hypothetical protein